jgi:hypothetical protein
MQQQVFMLKKIKYIFNKKFTIVLLLILITIPAVHRLIRPGFFSMYDDMQVIRLQQMDVCIKDGQIPCRWVPDLGYGYGYPLYQYYAPLPYYVMEAFHLLGFSFITSVKIGFILSVICSAFFFFLFVNRLFSLPSSLVATSLYIYSPIRAGDLYVRGAMGELWGIAILPLVFWGIERLIKNKNNGSVVILGIVLAFFSITHNLTVIMATPLIIVWILIRLVELNSKNRIGILKRLFYSGALGFAISAFYTIPLIVERNLVHLETLTQGYFNYLAHFVSLKQLFFSFHWGYGPSILGPNDDTSLSAGPLHVLMVFVSILTILKMKDKKGKLTFVGLLVLFFGFVFLTHQKSTFVWKTLPFMSYFQFPWRFLVVASFCSSILGSLVFENISKKWKNYVAIIFIITTLVVYGRFFTPKDWFPLTDNKKLSGEMLQRQITASIYDYLPKSASKAPDEPAPKGLIVETGEVEILQAKRGSNWFFYVVDVRSEEADIIIPTYDFPGWKVTVDKKVVSYQKKGELGLLGINVGKGQHKIDAKLQKSTSKLAGDYLSLSGILVAGYLMTNRKKTYA